MPTAAEDTTVVEDVIEQQPGERVGDKPADTKTEEGQQQQEENKEGQEHAEDKSQQDQTLNKNHATRRAERIARERAEARAEASWYKRRAEELQAQLSGGQQNTGSRSASGDRPVREQFSTDAEFNGAVMDWVEFKTAEASQQVAAAANKVNQDQTFKGVMAKTHSTHPDFAELVANNSDLEIPPHAEDAIRSSGLGGEILYWIAKNDEAAEKIFKLPVVDCIRELGKIEARIEASSQQQSSQGQQQATQGAAQQQTTARKAPAPIKPVQGQTPTKGPSQMSDTEWIDWRNEQIRKKRFG